MKQLGRAVLAAFLACACGGPETGSDGGGRDGQAIGVDGGGLDAAPVTVCSAPSDCDDGQHCNGAERCEPGGAGAGADGCVAASSPCMAGETCDEEADRCVPDDCVDPDGDNDGHERVGCGEGDDCDDEDGNRYPGNLEVCDAAGHDEDCNPETLGGRDTDTDGYIDADCCNGDLCGDDCDDSVGSVHPGVLDGCGAVDDDCDGMIDEDPDRTYYEDIDGDTYGVISTTVMRCAAPVGFAVNPGDCNDANFNVHPAAAETCNGVDDNCDLTPDNPPTGTCTCVDGASESCGPTTDVGRCTYGTTTCVAGGWTECAGATLPAAEICNGDDDDCDGAADDMDTDIAGSAPTSTGATLYYRDMDGDGAGDASMSVARCAPLAGHVTTAGDCNDGDSGVRPGAAETCDGVDQNCDGVIDNRPGGCVCVGGTTRPCGTDQGECVAGIETCLSGGWGTCSGVGPATETCNGVDDDCDGMTDELLLSQFWRDADTDGYGNPGTAVTACTAPAGYVSSGADPDCDDSNDDRSPGLNEDVYPCDGIDNDCDGVVDETEVPATANGRMTCYRDQDGDTYGVSTTTTRACSCPSGWVARAGDCQELGSRAPLIHPGAGFQNAGHCNGAPTNCTIGGAPGCLRSFPCTGCPGGISFVCEPTADFDYDCDGSVSPAPIGTSCGGIMSCSGRRGPASPADASDCGTSVLHSGGCTVACTTLANGYALLACR